jgi:hypothetical protein
MLCSMILTETQSLKPHSRGRFSQHALPLLKLPRPKTLPGGWTVLRLMKTLGRDNRPMASPNQLIIMACEGYSKRAATITLNAGSDAEGAWIALSDPTQSRRSRPTPGSRFQ